jgi:hypothetical protein
MRTIIYLFSTQPDVRIQNTCVIFSLSVLFILSHAWFLYLLQNSLEMNQKVEEHVYKKLDKENGRLKVFHVNIEKIRSQHKFSLKGFQWIVVQLFATVFLLLILGYINQLPYDSTKNCVKCKCFSNCD